MMDDLIQLPGTWEIYDDEKKVQGTLYFHDKKGIITLEVVLPADEENIMPSIAYKGKIPYINGKLLNGNKVLLYDCHTGKMHNQLLSHTKQIIYARYLFWGLNVSGESELRFKRARFDYSDLLLWTDLCKYSWEIIERGFNLKWESKEEIKLQTNNGTEISLIPMQEGVGGIKASETREITVKQFVAVDFRFSSSVTWDQIMKEADAFGLLCGFGVGRKSKILRSWYCHDFINDNMEGKSIERLGEVDCNREKEPQMQRSWRDLNFSLNDMIRDDKISKWMIEYEQLESVLDLYFEITTDKEYPQKMRYLNVAQALETFHARFIENDIKLYRQKIEQEMENYYHGMEDHQGWTKILLPEGRRKDILFRNRIGHLVFNGGDPLLYFGGVVPKEFVSKVVNTRNYLTHYDERIKDKGFEEKDIPWKTAELTYLLEYHILKLLGFDSKWLNNKIGEKYRILEIHYNIQNSTIKAEKK